MPSIDEFGLIARLFAPLARGHAGAQGLQDDCATIDGPGGMDWAISTDALVAGVHFLPDDPPDLIARKLVRVNLSDLASSGARPRFLLLSCCFPRAMTADWLEGFAAGLAADCRGFGLALIGGDTVATPGPLTLAATALGEVPSGQALLRGHARPGDDVWVSGTIGDAAFGLEVALGQAPDQSDLLERYRLPRPRLELGVALRGLAHACMDVSDGLVADLGQIAAASHLHAEIRAAEVPLSAAVRARLGGGGLERAVTGGDDYELLFTPPPERREALAALGRRLDLRLTRIGRMMPAGDLRPPVRLLDGQGTALALRRPGYRHF